MEQDKLENILDGNVDEVRSRIRDEEPLDYQELKQLETDGKDRKTIKKFLDKRIESDEKDQSDDSDEPEEDTLPDEQEASGDEDNSENVQDDGDRSEEDSKDESDSSGMAAKLQEPLDSLKSVSSIRGAAVVRRDGLLIASNMGEEINDDQVGAMTASIVGSGETASESLHMGGVDEVTVESNEGLLIATGAGDQGILAVLSDPDVNMGLVKVEIENAIEKVKQVL